MEVTSVDNAKVPDSVYSNSCSNSQSQSSDSSKSRHSNSSASSGYCGGNPSTLGSCNVTILQPISKREDKEHKKKKSKPVIVAPGESEFAEGAKESPLQDGATPVPPFVGVSQQTESQETVEVAPLQMVDATNPEDRNSDSEVTLDDSASATRCLTDDVEFQTNSFMPSPRMCQMLHTPKGSMGKIIRLHLNRVHHMLPKEEFSVVISMVDGVVLYTTTSLSTAVGFPKDTWVGRPFVDFVHPKDRSTFTDQIAKGIARPHLENSKGLNGHRISIFCRLQKYKGAEYNSNSANGNLEVEKPVRYLPCRLSITCRDLFESSSVLHPEAIFLVVTAQPVQSAYKVSEETIMSSTFTTHHTVTCRLSYCDPEVIQYFGYLPQEMIGRSLFEFYHPEDLPFIKDIYEAVIKLQGRSFRSKPYRFAVRNGGYATLETEWSSFVNPWSRKLEFVDGRHRVLKGPINPNVFQPSNDIGNSGVFGICEEVLEESKIIQGEIHALLNEEHDSLMLGEISPHHEHLDGKSSPETSPTYSELNYYEKIQRYFKSQPCTTAMYESEEENGNVLSSTEDEYLDHRAKSDILTDPASKYVSPENGSGASGCESVENSSSGSNIQSSSESRRDISVKIQDMTDTASFKLSTLTQSSLTKHKEDMENLLLDHCRKIRSTTKSDRLKNTRPNSVLEKSGDSVYPNKTPTLKRTGRPIENGPDVKVSKRDDISKVNTFAAVSSASFVQPFIIKTHSSSNLTARAYNSVGVPSAETAQPCTSAQTQPSQLPIMYPTIMQLVPLYYFATPRNGSVPTYIPQEHPGPPGQIQSPHQTLYNHYLTPGTAIYPSVMGIPTAMAIEYRPFMIPQSDLAVKNVCETTQPPMGKPEQVPCQNRLASQGTSVQAESGSIMAVSECSKKVLSPGENKCHSDENGTAAKVAKRDQSPKYHEDDSSCSSIYSSSWNKSNNSSLNLNPKESSEQSKSNGSEPTDVSNNDKEMKALRKQPSWLEGVKLTPELIYQYQMESKTLQEVLEADKKVLKKFTQPLLVNDQLSQLYLDLQLEGFGTKLMLNEGAIFSESASVTTTDEAVEDRLEQKKEKHCSMEHGRLVMIHDENAPLPAS